MSVGVASRPHPFFDGADWNVVTSTFTVLQNEAMPYGATMLTPKMLNEALEVTETTYLAWRAAEKAIAMRWAQHCNVSSPIVDRAETVCLLLIAPKESGTCRRFCQTPWTCS